jgi:hypothetical protein
MPTSRRLDQHHWWANGLPCDRFGVMIAKAVSTALFLANG